MYPPRVVVGIIVLALGAVAPWAAEAAHTPGTIFSDCPTCPTMVAIGPGTFEMGASEDEQHWYGLPAEFAVRERPRHPVRIAKPFAIAATETTQAQYAAFVQATHRTRDPKGCSVHDPRTDTYADAPAASWQAPGYPTGLDYPVVCVSWRDAAAYAAWLSRVTGATYRLPTEAEWEYAARAGTTTAAPWGDAAEALCAHANVMNSASDLAMGAPASWRRRLMCNGTHAYAQPVGGYPANALGLYDMIGNVWEWTQDCAFADYTGAPADGSAWITPDCPLRAIRGGAYHSAPYFGRSAARGKGQNPDHLSQAIGFRVVRAGP